jgi:peptidoglycan/xylan/chitin deacetylase (PgdA/CDA1 family)
VAEGHLLANHSYGHPSMSDLDADRIISEIKKTHEILLPHMRPNQRFYFRAPYGAWRPDVAEKINEDRDLREYIGPIYWNVGKSIDRDENGKLANAGDWACWRKKNGLSIDECLEGYLAKIESEKGGVILMHDIHRSTAEMFEKMLPILIQRGYTFVTMDEIPRLDLYQMMQPLKYDSDGKVQNF